MTFTFPLYGIGRVPGVFQTQGFGENPQTYKQFGLDGHNGLDWAAPRGYPVCAIGSGFVVEAAAKDTGYGLRVTQLIEVGELQLIVTYGHFLKINYPDIQWMGWDFYKRINPVRQGQILGFVDSTGFSTGDHLHLTIQIYKNGVLQNANNGYGGAVDPTPYLKGDPQMSNVLLVQKGSEFGFYVPATNEQAIIDKAINFGVPMPTKDNGTKVDWANVKPDIVI
jgi:hypothetical protein